MRLIFRWFGEYKLWQLIVPILLGILALYLAMLDSFNLPGRSGLSLVERPATYLVAALPASFSTIALLEIFAPGRYWNFKAGILALGALSFLGSVFV